ncbi:MAG: hypothetical protein ACLGH3_03950 [Actinomycetota bacterium]
MAANRNHRHLAALLAVALVGSLSAPALAGEDSYNEPARILWKAQTGYTLTSEPLNCELLMYCRNVYEFFRWDDWPALTRLDAPRTPSQQGTYEHELRFFDDANEPAALVVVRHQPLDWVARIHKPDY